MYVLNEKTYNEVYKEKDDNYVLLVLGILIFGNYIFYNFADFFKRVRKMKI